MWLIETSMSSAEGLWSWFLCSIYLKINQKNLPNESLKILRVIFFRDVVYGSIYDFVNKPKQIIGIKRMLWIKVNNLLQACKVHRVRNPRPKYLTCLCKVYFRKLPDFLLKNILPHVIRCSCHCLSSIVCIFQNFGNTEVPDFNVSCVFDENVGRFYISM